MTKADRAGACVRRESTSCSATTSGRLRAMTSTTRVRSNRPSGPTPLWMFQVMTRRLEVLLFNAAPPPAQEHGLRADRSAEPRQYRQMNSDTFVAVGSRRMVQV